MAEREHVTLAAAAMNLPNGSQQWAGALEERHAVRLFNQPGGIVLNENGGSSWARSAVLAHARLAEAVLAI